MKTNKVKCACCGEYVFDEDSLFEICPNCYWQQDTVQEDNPDYDGGANEMSLNEYRKEYFAKKRNSKL